MLRLKGKGAFDPKAKGNEPARGDLFAHIVVALPDRAEDIPADLVKLAERWREQGGYVPNPPARRR